MARILCIGGGPAGLYFALLAKKTRAADVVRVVERNRPYDTFGWGVVFSDQTLGNLRAADPESADEILDAFNHWDDIEIHFRGSAIRSSGHGFCGIGRKRLLNILQARCEALGVKLVFETDVTDDQTLAMQYQAEPARYPIQPMPAGRSHRRSPGLPHDRGSLHPLSGLQRSTIIGAADAIPGGLSSACP